MWRILGATLAIITAAGCRGDPQQCEQACRNFGNLVEWKSADADIAAAPPEQRDALRKDKRSTLDQHVERCVASCISGNNREQVDCLLAAKSADQALACTK